MNLPATDFKTASALTGRLSARLWHEVLCAFVTGIFYGFEFLLLLTELRPSRIFRLVTKSTATAFPEKLGTSARQSGKVGKISPRRLAGESTRKFC